MRIFSQIDVFSAVPGLGNPVAVVHDAEGLSDEEMARFAAWTNLSETTFLLPPSSPEADYHVRIWTPAAELPFAGHPTLGSARAWLATGGEPRRPGRVVQECGVGLVELRHDGERLAFAAPPVARKGPITSEQRQQLFQALRLEESQVLDCAWADNGPGWIGVLLDSADAVLAVDPDWNRFGDQSLGLIGRYDEEQARQVGALVEVRALCPGLGVVEDPVTGSLNASLAQWLIGNGTLPTSYVASQGTCLGRAGRVYVEAVDGEVWIGGDTTVVISGTVEL